MQSTSIERSQPFKHTYQPSGKKQKGEGTAPPFTKRTAMPSKNHSLIVTQTVFPAQLPPQKLQRRLKKAVPDPHPLKIERLPDTLQWWDEERYWLIHEASGLRVPGSFSIAEAQHIRAISKDWDWRVDIRDRKVACGIRLLSLAEAVCKRSLQRQGGKA